MSALLKASVQVLKPFLLLCGEKTFLRSLNYVGCCIYVELPHVQDAISDLSPQVPDQKVALIFEIYQCPRQVSGLVVTVWNGPPALHGETWVYGGLSRTWVGVRALMDRYATLSHSSL